MHIIHQYATKMYKYKFSLKYPLHKKKSCYNVGYQFTFCVILCINVEYMHYASQKREPQGGVMIKVGIIGATGYAGNELVRLLLGHKDAEIVWLGSRSYIDQNYSDVYRNMFKLVDAKCMDDNMEQLANEVDVIFTATPQGLCASLVNDEILSKTKIIDLSADFRLKDVNVYEQWYKLEHKAPQYIDEAVYGLCEINRDKVSKDTRIIANPGCYTTTSILTLY